MKKVTKLLAAMAVSMVASIGSVSATTVAGVELTDWSVGAINGDLDTALSLGTTAPIALAGVEFNLNPRVGWNGDDLLLDLNLGYDVAEVLGTTVSAVGGVGLNWLETEDVAFDVRVGAGLSYPVAEDKAIFATYTLGYDFEEENDNTELLLGVSFKF